MARVDVSIIFFFKQKTAYEMRISDWSSDVCSSDLSSAYFGANYMQQTTESQNWVDEDGAALERLLRQRHSVRGFLARPIPAPLLTRVFELAQLAPSNVNAQPWRVDILSGRDRKRVVKGKSVSVREDLCGRRLIKTQQTH